MLCPLQGGDIYYGRDNAMGLFQDRHISAFMIDPGQSVLDGTIQPRIYVVSAAIVDRDRGAESIQPG